MKAIDAYSLLLKRFGPQGWWPLSGLNAPVKEGDKDYANYRKAFPDGTGADFRRNWPRHLGAIPSTDGQRFEIVAGAILTQYLVIN